MSLARALAVFFALSVGTLGCGSTIVWYGHSPDRRHLVEVVEDLSSQTVRLDGEQGEPFAGIAPEAIVFSVDGKRLAYAAEDEQGWRVVVDGARGSAWDGIGDVVFSPDGKSVAYAALQHGRWRVIRDGAAGPAFEALLQGTLRFSADGVHLAYVARTRGKVSAVLDHHSGPPYDGIANLSFASSDGQLGYVARRSDRSHLIVGGVEGPAYDGIGEVVFAAGRYAYAALREPSWVAIVDGVEQKPYDRVDALRVTADGKHLAYVARQGQHQLVVLDGVESKPYRQVQQATLGFAPDGRLAYAAWPGPPSAEAQASGQSGVRMFLGGIPGPELDEVQPPVFAAHGVRWGYIGRRAGRAFVIIDGHESVPYVWARDLDFSPDGTEFAYLARQSSHGMVVRQDGRTALPSVVGGSLVMDRTGRHWACLVGVRSVGQLFIVIDGLPDKAFDMAELAAALAQARAQAQPGRPVDAAFVRRWVAAEFAAARATAVRDRVGPCAAASVSDR